MRAFITVLPKPSLPRCFRLAASLFAVTALCASVETSAAQSPDPAPPRPGSPLAQDSSSAITDPGHESSLHYLTSFPMRLMHDYSAQATYPIAYAWNNPRGLFLRAAGIAALVLTDPYTYNAVHSYDPADVVRSASRLSEWGTARTSLTLVLGFGAVGVFTHSDREKETASMLAEAIITSSTWTALIKAATGRQRPRITDGTVANWTGPGEVFENEETSGDGYRSFPSGHSTGAWAVATVIANQYPRYKIVPVLAYTGAAAMSYSRIVVDAHWLSDVVVGGLIGYGCAKQVLASHKGAMERNDAPRLSMGLDFSRDYKGVHLTMGF